MEEAVDGEVCVGENIPLKKRRDKSSRRECRVLMLARVRAHSYGSTGNAIFIALFCIPSSRSESDTVRPVCHIWQAYSNSERTSESISLQYECLPHLLASKDAKTRVFVMACRVSSLCVDPTPSHCL